MELPYGEPDAKFMTWFIAGVALWVAFLIMSNLIGGHFRERERKKILHENEWNDIKQTNWDVKLLLTEIKGKLDTAVALMGRVDTIERDVHELKGKVENLQTSVNSIGLRV